MFFTDPKRAFKRRSKLGDKLEIWNPDSKSTRISLRIALPSQCRFQRKRFRLSASGYAHKPVGRPRVQRASWRWSPQCASIDLGSIGFASPTLSFRPQKDHLEQVS